MADQLTTVSKLRLMELEGRLSVLDMRKLEQAVRVQLGLSIGAGKACQRIERDVVVELAEQLGGIFFPSTAFILFERWAVGQVRLGDVGGPLNFVQEPAKAVIVPDFDRDGTAFSVT